MNVHDLNLLIVEDDDFQRQMVMTMVRGLGVESITETANGRMALDIIRCGEARPFDIALCDLNMPEMDGMEFLRHLSIESHDIAIIITSALDGKLLASVGRMTKMYGIKLLGSIEKPILPSKLHELLAKHEHTETKWLPPQNAKSYSLAEIQTGITLNQFEPYFQPKVSLSSGEIVGAAVLARWHHPQDGIIPPYAFIPHLEANRGINDLTFQILRKSAIAWRSLQRQGHEFTISVNLSLVSLDAPELADRITQIVRDQVIDPKHVVLEITESAAITDVLHALENLARLCMNGFALSIDDYGTGYSSLQQLTRVAFSELKIDQSFVKDLSENESSRIVVESCIDMAHKLSVSIVAEGVETLEDWDMLKRVGCDIAQGYLIAKPMNLSDFTAFLAEFDPTAIGSHGSR
ncbi:EAL domain-containing response regulator [Halothiobacillus diazotrophicus]|uniref:EAL domain-containing response regulator n=1 Tax=Halothiobacillus diazotrophicus TaxID=1860122 RepID=UPI0012E83F9E|nr:EAL domain-containing response regulator [Halothiobacillus diazotrophicus]